jgi:hypothetical protein
MQKQRRESETPRAAPPAERRLVAAAAEPQPVVPAATAQTATPTSPDSAPAASTAGGSTGADDYVPRRFLTSPPVAHGPVMVPYPADGPLEAHRVAILNLYIDESGVVRRVRSEGEPLPPSFEAAAQSAFMAARFVPGSIDGRIVKSLIRVEVTFESRPSDAADVPAERIGVNPG